MSRRQYANGPKAGERAEAGGFDSAASARRIWASYRGTGAERAPVTSPIPWWPTEDIDAAHFNDWRDDNEFRRVARLVQDCCDFLPPWNPVGHPPVFAPQSYQRFLEAPAEFIEQLPPEKIGPSRTRHATVLHTPKGDLTWVQDVDAGVLTRWDRRRPIESLEDVDRMLSVPWKFAPPAPSAFDAFRKRREEAGRDFLGGAHVNTMVAMLCGMMEFGLLLEWVVTEPDVIRALADAWMERTGSKVDWLLAQGVGPFWHFNGIERASPPMMGPRQWEDLVVPYDGEIMRRIKAHDPESRIHVHCHGRVGTLLDSFLAMGVDSLDPVEPLPQGDITFADARRKVGGRMTLCGNIEFLDMETREPDEIEGLVRRTFDEGGRERTILLVSATPHERPTERFIANAVRYIEAGVKYGGG
jgi:hypothetical protein